MINANELIKQQIERKNNKVLTFKKIYNLITKKICMSSKCNNYYTWYQVPEFILGLPSYSLNECIQYIITKLKKNGFTADFYNPNIIFISWIPK